MPERRRQTPSQFVVLESFLWRNLKSAEEWAVWTPNLTYAQHLP
jgi:hypothetical protein